MVNVVATEFVIVVSYVILLLIGIDGSLIVNLLLGLAVIFPLAFYHHGWSLWLSFNHLVNPLPKAIEEGFSNYMDE